MTGGFAGALVVVNAGAWAASVVVEVKGSSGSSGVLAAAVVVEVEGSSGSSGVLAAAVVVKVKGATIAAVKPPSNFKPAAEFSSLATKLTKKIGRGGESGDTDQGQGGVVETRMSTLDKRRRNIYSQSLVTPRSLRLHTHSHFIFRPSVPKYTLRFVFSFRTSVWWRGVNLPGRLRRLLCAVKLDRQ